MFFNINIKIILDCNHGMEQFLEFFSFENLNGIKDFARISGLPWDLRIALF